MCALEECRRVWIKIAPIIGELIKTQVRQPENLVLSRSSGRA
jgi:hypothetical protein